MFAECYSQWLNPHSRGSWCVPSSSLFILEGAVVLLNMDRCSCCCLETKRVRAHFAGLPPSTFKPVPRRSACASITYTWMIKCRLRCCGSDNGDQVAGRLVRQRTNLKSNEKCFNDSWSIFAIRMSEQSIGSEPRLRRGGRACRPQKTRFHSEWWLFILVLHQGAEPLNIHDCVVFLK